MKQTLVLFSFILCFISGVFGQGKSEKLLLGGSGWGKIVIIDKSSKQIEWEYPLQKGWECNSVAATPDGNVLFSYRKGAKVVTHDHQELWNIAAPDSCEMQTARVLPDGNYLLGWTGHPAVIMEVNPKGEILSRTEYETGIQNPHSQFRQVNKNARGNYLIPLLSTSEVHEISPSGELIKSIKLEGNPFTVLASTDGNYWVAGGDGHILTQVNLDNHQTVRRFGETDIKGVRLFFVAGLCTSKGGGLYVCNWQGHSRDANEANSPQLFEMNHRGEVVWSLNDNKTFGMISAVSVINQ